MIVFVIFAALCGVNMFTLTEKKIYMVETIDYYMYVIDVMRDVSIVVDYLKVRSLHHVKSFFWWGDIH